MYHQTVQTRRCEIGPDRSRYCRHDRLRSSGLGRQKGQSETYRGAEYQVEFLPKIMITLVIADDQVASAVEAIQEAARTGRIGDGKIFVTDVEQAVRIRTGESGIDSL